MTTITVPPLLRRLSDVRRPKEPALVETVLRLQLGGRDGGGSTALAARKFVRHYGDVRDCWVHSAPAPDDETRLLGAVRTSRGFLWVRYPAADTTTPKEIYDGLWRLRMLIEQTRALLSPRCRRIIARRLMPVAAVLLDVMAHPPAPAELAPAARSACAELDLVLADIKFRARARRQLYHLAGMVACIVTILLVTMGFEPRERTLGGEPLSIFMTAATFGCVGALMSVLRRINQHKFRIEHDAAISQAVITGLCRPLIGAALAVMLTIAVRAGVVLQPPSTANPELFVPLVAFLAGFSERWATMMLKRTTDDNADSAAAPGEWSAAPEPPVSKGDSGRDRPAVD